MKNFKITRSSNREIGILISILFLLCIFIPIFIINLVVFIIPYSIIFLFYLFYKKFSNRNSVLIKNGYRLSQNKEDIIYYGNIKYILDAGIDKVGWNDNWIICCLKNVQPECKWYAINLKTEEIVPPFSEDFLRKNTDLNSIQYDTCENVWNNYHSQSGKARHRSRMGEDNR